MTSAIASVSKVPGGEWAGGRAKGRGGGETGRDWPLIIYPGDEVEDSGIRQDPPFPDIAGKKKTTGRRSARRTVAAAERRRCLKSSPLPLWMILARPCVLYWWSNYRPLSAIHCECTPLERERWLREKKSAGSHQPGREGLDGLFVFFLSRRESFGRIERRVMTRLPPPLPPYTRE